MYIQLVGTDTKLHIRERVLNFWRMRWVASINPDDLQYLNLRLVNQFNLGKRPLRRFAISKLGNFFFFRFWWLVNNRLSSSLNSEVKMRLFEFVVKILLFKQMFGLLASCVVDEKTKTKNKKGG